MEHRRTTRTASGPSPDGPAPGPGITQDAVVIVPGIMGSELYDTEAHRTVWGLSGVSWLLRAWTRPGGLEGLRLTEAEREGRSSRIRPTQLMRHSSWTPYLKGLEPYTALIASVHGCVADPAAILEFPYDWRLPVVTNARLLADAARRHLTAWQEHPAHQRARLARVDERPARLVFVAHSMGGLVTQAALDPLFDSDLARDTRAVITLGTPFYGAVKATAILNSGRGAPVPLPHRRLKSISTTMPGLYDLLPQYSCLIDSDDARRLTPGDVTDIGGDAELAASAADSASKRSAIELPGHRTVVGTGQKTMQNLVIRDGVVEPLHHTVRRHRDQSLIREQNGRLRFYDVKGDGTVHKESAALGPAVTPLPLQHGAVASDRIALRAVEEMLREDEHLGPPMGGHDCGLDTPDLAEAGRPWSVVISGVPSPAGLRCAIHAVEGHAQFSPTLRMASGRVRATVTVPEPGLYRVSVRTRDGSHVSQLVLVTPPEN